MKIDSVKLYIAVGLTVVGCGLLIAGFAIAPSGEIHNSVLIAFGEIMTFVGSVLCINYHWRSEFLQLQKKSPRASQQEDSRDK